MINFHVINEEYMEENKEIHILLNDGKEAKRLDITMKREKYFSKEYDIALIQLIEKDKIKEYLELDDNILKDDEQIYYEKNQYIYYIIYWGMIYVHHMVY